MRGSASHSWAGDFFSSRGRPWCEASAPGSLLQCPTCNKCPTRNDRHRATKPFGVQAANFSNPTYDASMAPVKRCFRETRDNKTVRKKNTLSFHCPNADPTSRESPRRRPSAPADLAAMVGGASRIRASGTSSVCVICPPWLECTPLWMRGNELCMCCAAACAAKCWAILLLPSAHRFPSGAANLFLSL